MSERICWRCVCGWSIERDRNASNLPAANNERIARTVAELHVERPRFGAAREAQHAVKEVPGDD